MIIGIDMGHTIEGPNYGAIGYLKESEQTRVLGNKVIKHLKDMGHTVINCTVDKASSNGDSISRRISAANKQNLDLFVSIHFNSGGGYGVEVLTKDAKYLKQADIVLQNLEIIRLKNRGIKSALTSKGDKVGVVHRTNATAMLVEVCFVDSKTDTDLYKANIDKIAKGISHGIVGIEVKNYGVSNKEDDDMLPTIKLAACVDSKIKDFMVGKIKELQGCVSLPQTGIATNELCLKLPIFKGGEEKGSASILQELLQLKGYLSKGKILPLGPAVKDAIERFRKDNGLPGANAITDPLVWRKLIEY